MLAYRVDLILRGLIRIIRKKKDITKVNLNECGYNG